MVVIGPITDESKRPGGTPYDLNEEKKAMAEATEELKKEIRARWEKKYRGVPIFPPAVASIHPEVVNFMLSFQLTGLYDSLQQKFRLSQSQRDTLPKLVWWMASKNDFSGLEEGLSHDLGMNDTAAVREMARVLSQNIEAKVNELAKRPVQSQAVSGEKEKVGSASVRLSEALKKYEKLGEQLITLNPIKLKIFPSPVRPSIKNWIADYYEKAEARKHDSIERGNYLFHTENAKRLTAGERQKLGAILRALDEEGIVRIDPDKQEMSFESYESGAVNPGTADQAPRPVQNASIRPASAVEVVFSSPQKLPVERSGGNAAPAAPPQGPRFSGNVVDLRNQ